MVYYTIEGFMLFLAGICRNWGFMQGAFRGSINSKEVCCGEQI